MVWLDSNQLIKRCDYCNESMSVFEGYTEHGKYYHQSCMIHLLSKNILKYRKKFLNRKLTPGDCVEVAEMWNLRERMLADRTVFKGIKPVLTTETQTKVFMEKMVDYVPCTRDLKDDVERVKNEILKDLNIGEITEEQARDRLADLMRNTRDLARQQATVPVIKDGKIVFREESVTVKEFRYEVRRPVVERIESKQPLRLTTSQAILDKMREVCESEETIDHPVFKLLIKGDSEDDSGSDQGT